MTTKDKACLQNLLIMFEKSAERLANKLSEVRVERLRLEEFIKAMRQSIEAL